MLKLIGKALVGMVLTKEAREAAGDLAQNAIKTAVKKATLPDQRQQAIAAVQAQAAELSQSLVTPDRAELIRQAMQVRAAKQSLLSDLNDVDRAKLVAVAMKAFLNEGKDEKR